MSTPPSPVEPLRNANGDGRPIGESNSSRMMLAALTGILAVGLCIAIVYAVKTSFSKTVPFTRGEPIAVGSHAFTFRDVEAFTSVTGEDGLAVFFSFEGDPPVSSLKVALFFKSHFRLVDAKGKKYSAVTAMSAEAYRSRHGARDVGTANDGQMPHDWVAVFRVPPESRGFTLLFDHPTPRHDQADLYAAPLGR